MYDEGMSLDDVMAFWEWFDETRDDLSVRQVEERADAPRGRIGNVYSAKSSTSELVCESIAAGLGISKAEVLRRAGRLPGHATKDEQVEELLHYYDQLPPDLQAHFRTMVKALAESTTGGQEAEEDARDRALDEAPAAA